MKPLALEEVASRAGVEDAYVRRLAELGALEGQGDGYGEQDVHRVALLHSWETAGLSPEWILTAVRQGELSFSFLETPGWELPGRPDRTYRELSEQQGVPLSLILGLHEAIGFQPPSPDERVRQDELVTVMSWECSLSPSSVIDGGGVSQLMLAGRARPSALSTSPGIPVSPSSRETRSRPGSRRA
jgi:hypothetical protein